jgi:hypothetical protein
MADQNKNLGVYGYCEGSYRKGNRLRSHSVCPVCTALFVREKTGIPLHKIGQGVFRVSKNWWWLHWVLLPFAVIALAYMTWQLAATISSIEFFPERPPMTGRKSELLSPAELGR